MSREIPSRIPTIRMSTEASTATTSKYGMWGDAYVDITDLSGNHIVRVGYATPRWYFSGTAPAGSSPEEWAEETLLYEIRRQGLLSLPVRRAILGAEFESALAVARAIYARDGLTWSEDKYLVQDYDDGGQYEYWHDDREDIEVPVGYDGEKYSPVALYFEYRHEWFVEDVAAIAVEYPDNPAARLAAYRDRFNMEAVAAASGSDGWFYHYSRTFTVTPVRGEYDSESGKFYPAGSAGGGVRPEAAIGRPGFIGVAYSADAHGSGTTVSWSIIDVDASEYDDDEQDLDLGPSTLARLRDASR